MQDLWIISSFILTLFIFPLSLAIFLWIFLEFFLLLRWYCLFQYQLPLELRWIHFLKNPRCFFDSIKALHLYIPCLMGMLLIASTLFAFFSSPHFYFSLSLFCLSALATLLCKNNPLPKPPISLSFPEEISVPISSHYPALRKTIAFLGEKKVPELKEEKPHIIFLFLESFRAKNVGCLKASIPASPHFDAWSRKGLLFRNFHANGLQTFRAFISAYFGIPGHIRSVSLKPFCDLSLRGLPQILKTHGYHPAIIQSGDLSFDHLYPFFKRHGFETILGGENIPINKKRQNSWGIDDEWMVRFAADFLEKQVKPTFLSLFTITNHHPWKSPNGWIFPVPKNIPLVYQNFLQTFAYTDHCLGIFLSLLKEKNLLKNSILFIAGDHGQEMNERRAFSEINHGLFEEHIHLPLLILGETIPAAVIDRESSFIDFPATVMDLLNIQDVHHGLGRSLIRNSVSPSYFSLQRANTEIGCILEKKKIIITPNQAMKFDLEKDPEEKNNIANDADPLISSCTQYFHTIETIYNANAWAPPLDTPFQIKAKEAMDDEKWISFLHAHPPISVVDLSPALRLSDQAILKTNPRYAADWHRLTLANLKLTDSSLKWIGRHCQNIMSLNLSHCHLFTDIGVEAILSMCTQLRHLWLDGVEDLSDFVPKNTLFNLNTCSLKEALNIQGKAISRLYTHSPYLVDWSASLEKTSDEDLLEMALHKKRCTHMALSQGRTIQDHALSALIAAQEQLQEIHLEDFPLLEKPLFSPLQKLRYLDISNCPHLTDAVFESLKNLPLLRLRLQRCPKITKNGLSLLAQNGNLHVFLDECLGISLEEACQLRASGLYVF